MPKFILKKKLVISFTNGRPFTVSWKAEEARLTVNTRSLTLQRPESKMVILLSKVDYWVIETYQEEVKKPAAQTFDVPDEDEPLFR